MKYSFLNNSMHKLLISGVFLAICLISSLPCYSQWTQVSTGMYGGPIWQLVSHKGTLFAGTGYSGLFASTNNGVSWAPSNQGLSVDDSPVNAIVSSDNAMYVSFNNYADWVSVSKDNGATWSSFSNGLTTAVTRMARSADTLFALGNDDKTVFLTTEGDGQWKVIDTGLNYVQSIAIKGNNLFVGSATSGVYLSSNSGATWTPVNSGLSNLTIYSLDFSGSNLIAGTGSGIFISSNNGTSWSSTGLPANYFYASACDNSVFASGPDGVYVSMNNGTSWSLHPYVENGFNRNQFAVNDSIIFTGTVNGVYRSSNGGATWTDANNGLTITPVIKLASSGNTLLAGTYDGRIFVSTNKGNSWSISNVGLPVTTELIRSFAVTDSSVFVAIWRKGIYKSYNDGVSWAHVNTGLVDSTTIALGASGNTIIASSLNAGTFISGNNGGTWSAFNSGLPDATMVNGWLVNPVSSFVINANDKYALVSGVGVYVSTNNGPWSPLSPGLSNPLISCMVFNGGNLFTGAYQGSYTGVSFYNGTIWSPIYTGIKYVTALAENENTIFAGGLGVGVSSDGGTSWSVWDNPDHWINSLLIIDDTIYAGTTAGVWSAPIMLSDFMPKITSFAPGSGSVGTLVTITGENFDPVPAKNSVTFNGVSASVITASVTQLTINVPINATTGPIDVVTHGYTLTSTSNFCVSPPKPTITANLANPSNPILTSSSAAGNQWYMDGTAISGATDITLSVTTSGTYTVQVTDDCQSPVSDGVTYLILGDIDPPGVLGIRVYPVPAGEWITIDMEDLVRNQMVTLEVYNQLGQRVHDQNCEGGDHVQLPIGLMSNGMYFVRACQMGKSFVEKFIKR